MSVIEFAWVDLGHNEARREYNDRYGYMETVYEWVKGCGPSGEIGVEACLVNVSDKKIDKVTLICEALDVSGDVVGKEVKLQFTTISKYNEDVLGRGLESEEKERVWIAPTAKEVNIKRGKRSIYEENTENCNSHRRRRLSRLEPCNSCSYQNCNFQVRP